MFTGFTPETVDFLWGIRMNNNRDWFQTHKQQYVDTLYQPMKELGAELFQPFLERSGDVLKVSRIYRDARMHPPEPYKESLWICIRRDVDWWAENPCLYFELNPDRAHYGFCLWRPSTVTMETFRQRLSQQPKTFLDALAKAENAVGQPITAECYKRPKLPEDPALAPYFAWRRDISCIRELQPGEPLFSPGLAREVSDFFQGLLPVYDYFNSLF